MQLFFRQTVQQVKEADPLLNTIVKRFPGFFMPNGAQVSVEYRVAKVAAQYLLWVSSLFIALQATFVAPILFATAFSAGMGCGAILYIAQRILRNKLQYEGSWSLLYIQGTAILKKKWRWIEGGVLCGVALAALAFSSKLTQHFPSWPYRQTGLGSGISVGYFGADLLTQLFKRLFRPILPLHI
jgi:hypothetical protein